MKELEIGKNYITVFAGFNGTTKNQLIYMGGIKFNAVKSDGTSIERDSQDSYNKIKETINMVNVSMGMPGGKF